MNSIVLLGAGIVAGAILTVISFVMVMRARMVVTHRSRQSFKDTCATIERVVEAGEGWGFPIETWNFYETFAQKNLVPDHFTELKVYFVCNAGLASRLLSAVPGFVGMMPCSWAVYELDDGSVHLSKLNIGLMTRMFDGITRAVMGEVARADDEFIPVVLGRR